MTGPTVKDSRMTGPTVKDSEMTGPTVKDSGIEYMDVEVFADCDDSLLRLGFCELSREEGDLPVVLIEGGAIVDTDRPLLLNVGIGCCDGCSVVGEV